MKAARWHGRRDVRVEDVPRPEPGPGEALLRVTWCGICGTDVEEYLEGPVIIPTARPNGLTGRRAPLTMGHEFTGTVEALGEGVDTLRVGQRVAPEAVLFCGLCPYCRQHQYALCLNWAALGLQADGGLAEYAVVPAFSCAPLPDSLSDEEGALVEPTEVAVRAVAKAPPRLGGSVAVLGGGAIGLLVLQVAHAAGAGAVYLVEPRASRRALALELGAAAAVDPTTTDWMDELRDRCDGLGPEVVLECAGTRDSAGLAVRAARKGGRIVLVGITPDTVPIPTLDILVGEKRVIGTIQHHYDEDLPAAIQLLADGRVRAAPLISARIPLDAVVGQGFLALADRARDTLKILVSPSI
jgi:(R,R)-butanediol dehydrogenase/meso-butanediol dehydrogenase/diacetyl reductase